MLAFAHCGPGDPALEVGAGTGKATRLFAARGLDLLALEPDARMAAVASRQAATAGLNVRTRVVEFERAHPGEHAFRLILAAQSWHWIDAATRYRLAARALAQGGALAVFWNQVDWRRSPLQEALSTAYARSGVQLRDHGPMFPGEPTPLDLGDDWLADIDAEPDLSDPQTRTYRWSEQVSTDEYVALLATHSDHIALSAAHRGRLFDEIRAVLDAAGGSLELPYFTLLCLARAG